MRLYLEPYFELYWDLHLGVSDDAIPAEVHDFAESLNVVLAYRDPTLQGVYENYMRVHSLLPRVREWIDRCLVDLANGKTEHPERTFAYYWMRNGEGGEHFQRADIVSECVHDFFAFNQFGTTIYNIMLKLSANAGDDHCKTWFRKTTQSERTDGGPFTCPFDRAMFEVKDGRNVGLANSGFGTVYPVIDGKPLAACEQAGFAPFGFGYRRCPGERFTIKVFEDFLSKVWSDKIAFEKLDLPDPERVPIGPGHVTTDDFGFSCSA
jgi:hypothetical protein